MRLKTLTHGSICAFGLHNRIRDRKSQGDFLQIIRSLALVLPFVFLSILSAPAQEQVPRELLSEISDISSTGNYTICPVQAVSLSDAAAPQKAKVKVIDKKFIAVMAALGGAESLRFTTHKLVLDNEYAAGAPWVTSVPHNQRLVLKYSAIYAAEVLVAYELKKPHSWLPGDKYIRKFWWAYPAVMAPIHIKNGIRSIRTQAPAGCPPELCEGQ